MIIRKLFQKIKLFILKKQISSLKLLACDVDGVLTDNYLIYNQDGNIMRNFNVKDGLGIKILQSIGVEVCFISGGKGESILKRAKDLNIKKVYMEVKNKSNKIIDIMEEFSLKAKEVIYVGDDINDLIVRKNVLLFIAPKDSHAKVLKRADYITYKKGGEGVIREVADIIIKSKRFEKNGNLDFWINTN